MQLIEVGKFTVVYHQADNVIPRFPPLAILCRELYTLVIKTKDEHVALHVGNTEDGAIQCLLSHSGMSVRYEADHLAHFLLDFNFSGQYFMLLHHPLEFSSRGETKYELVVQGQSLVFSHQSSLHWQEDDDKTKAVIYDFPLRAR